MVYAHPLQFIHILGNSFFEFMDPRDGSSDGRHVVMDRRSVFEGVEKHMDIIQVLGEHFQNLIVLLLKVLLDHGTVEEA